MRRQEVELTTNVMNMLMQGANLGLSFSVVSRTLFLVSQFTLQPSKLALQIHEKARAFYQFSRRSQVDGHGSNFRQIDLKSVVSVVGSEDVSTWKL
jgi:hypothetical protein